MADKWGRVPEMRCEVGRKSEWLFTSYSGSSRDSLDGLPKDKFNMVTLVAWMGERVKGRSKEGKKNRKKERAQKHSRWPVPDYQVSLWCACLVAYLINILAMVACEQVLKIEGFHALQTRFGPSTYTSLKTTLWNATPKLQNEDVTWSARYNLLATRTNKRRALSLQELELDGWFLILHIVLETSTIWFMHTLNMSFEFHFYILELTSWIWTRPFNWKAEIWEPFKMKLIWEVQSWTLLMRRKVK